MNLDQSIYCRNQVSFPVFYGVLNYLLGLQVIVHKYLNEVMTIFQNLVFLTFAIIKWLILESCLAQKTIKTACEVLQVYLAGLGRYGFNVTANVVQSKFTYKANIGGMK